jgi:hypothetical protein
MIFIREELEHIEQIDYEGFTYDVYLCKEVGNADNELYYYEIETFSDEFSFITSEYFSQENVQDIKKNLSVSDEFKVVCQEEYSKMKNDIISAFKDVEIITEGQSYNIEYFIDGYVDSRLMLDVPFPEDYQTFINYLNECGFGEAVIVPIGGEKEGGEQMEHEQEREYFEELEYFDPSTNVDSKTKLVIDGQRAVLAMRDKGYQFEYVTWLKDKFRGGFDLGNYFTDLEEAKKDFVVREGIQLRTTDMMMRSVMKQLVLKGMSYEEITETMDTINNKEELLIQELMEMAKANDYRDVGQRVLARDMLNEIINSGDYKVEESKVAAETMSFTDLNIEVPTELLKNYPDELKDALEEIVYQQSNTLEVLKEKIEDISNVETLKEIQADQEQLESISEEQLIKSLYKEIKEVFGKDGLNFMRDYVVDQQWRFIGADTKKEMLKGVTYIEVGQGEYTAQFKCGLQCPATLVKIPNGLNFVIGDSTKVVYSFENSESIENQLFNLQKKEDDKEFFDEYSNDDEQLSDEEHANIYGGDIEKAMDQIDEQEMEM